MDEFSLPGSIKAVIGERLDRLPLKCRELLRVAAVIGREIPLRLLCQVMSCDETVLAPNIRQLEQNDFVHLTGTLGSRHIVFNHALSRDVAYSTMVRPTRRAIHRAVLDAHEVLNVSRLDEYVETMSAHAIAAGEWERATAYLQRAAEKAITRSTHLRAIAYIADAIRFLAQTDWPLAAKGKRELDLRLLLRSAYNAIGNYKERLINLDRAETLATELGITSSLASIWISRAGAMLHVGKVDEAIRLGRRARQAAVRHHDFAASINAGYSLTRAYFYAGRLPASLASGKRTLALMASGTVGERLGGSFGSSEVMLQTQCAQNYACCGQFVLARQSALRAVVTAKQTRRSFDAALAAYGLGVVHFYEGSLAEAVQPLETGLAACTVDGVQSMY